MGKQGPCYHCGVTSTPLWRNGPPEKPVLCNACGSRWRTKGTLANYTPLHARTDPDDSDNYKVSRVKLVSNRNKEEKVMKRKQNHFYSQVGAPPDYNQGLLKGLDEDTSNRSSSGSAVSNSESCAEFGGTEVSDLTGPAQPNVWDTMVPSRKRTCFTRPKPSPVEKLTKDLYTILHEQQSLFLSGSSAEDLLLESDKPMVSVEIGHGSMLIRHPSSIGREEESEASSLSVDNKQLTVNEAYSPLSTPVHNCNKKGVINSQDVGTERVRKPTGLGMELELVKRDKDQLEEFQILGHLDSPLHYIDLKDVKYKSSSSSYEVAGGPSDISSVNVKRSRDGQDQKPSGAKTVMKSPIRVTIKGAYEHKELVETDGICFSPKHLFALPPDNSSLVLDSFGFATESSDQDLLLDVPSNSSFPQAELLADSQFQCPSNRKF